MRCALDTQPDPACRTEPDLRERVDISMGHVASHAVV
jgi:hypothetical protein